MIQITCYQTCKIESKDWQTLYNEFPHHAWNGKNKFQWLSDGYYFWPDSVRFAEWWGKDRLKQPYCITRYSIHIEHAMIFDMVGNVSHIEYFFEHLLRAYKVLFEKARKFSPTKLPEPTIATVIDHMRKFYKEQVFNFRAMKVYDAWIDENFAIDFTPGAKGTEYFPGLPRIQICIFTGEEECIRDKTPHFPVEYCNDIAVAT